MSDTTCPREGKVDSLWRWRVQWITGIWKAANKLGQGEGVEIPIRVHLITAWRILRCTDSVCDVCHEPMKFERGQWLHTEAVVL